MPLVESRFPSVYSLQQLAVEVAAGSAPRSKAPQPDGKRVVSELAGASLPKITFGRTVPFHRKRIRSSEEAVVPDVDYPPSEDSCAPAAFGIYLLTVGVSRAHALCSSACPLLDCAVDPDMPVLSTSAWDCS